MVKGKRSRRSWLALCAGTTAGMTVLAGCAGDDEGGVGSDSVDGGWPQHRYDAANRNVVEEWTGPTNPVDIDWTYETGERGRSPPVVEDGIVCTLTRDNNLYAIDAISGELEWKYSMESGPGAIPPAISNGIVYASGQTLLGIDLTTGEKRYDIDLEDNNIGNIRITNGLIYVSDNDSLFAVDPELSEVVWKAEAHTLVQDMAVGSDNTVYIKDSDQYVEAFDSESGELLWEYQSPESGETGITVIDKKVYTFHEDEIVVIDGQNGNAETVSSDLTSPESVPTIAEGVAYAPGHVDSPLIAVDLDSQAEPSDWNIEPGTFGISLAVVTEDIIYYWRGFERLHALDRQSGEIYWEYEVDYGDGSAFPKDRHAGSQPVVTSNRIFYNEQHGLVVSLSEI